MHFPSTSTTSLGWSGDVTPYSPGGAKSGAHPNPINSNITAHTAIAIQQNYALLTYIKSNCSTLTDL
ncbi:hypothetical protein HMPREF0454_00168 [Hafnia alvei ATCC 51873]|uniref:Uncharacterized protein n=1 Tax=Hafnia alvei ATCC 51873 TaxID=1002364 RepID=G9Y0W0_HAFAL|nr:hypothetical protein HMPREF0454_00168 [Hafnia alvei ATCC 51873]